MITIGSSDEVRRGQLSSFNADHIERKSPCGWMFFKPAGLNDHNIPRDEGNLVPFSYYTSIVIFIY